MSGTDGVRISVDVTQETHNKLTAMLPWGSKAEVVRSLIELLVKTQEGHNRYIVEDLLKGRCTLIVGDKDNVQNLNVPVTP